MREPGIAPADKPRLRRHLGFEEPTAAANTARLFTEALAQDEFANASDAVRALVEANQTGLDDGRLSVAVRGASGAILALTKGSETANAPRRLPSGRLLSQ